MNDFQLYTAVYETDSRPPKRSVPRRVKRRFEDIFQCDWVTLVRNITIGPRGKMASVGRGSAGGVLRKNKYHTMIESGIGREAVQG